MRTEGILRWFIFWRGSGVLSCKNVKITMFRADFGLIWWLVLNTRDEKWCIRIYKCSDSLIHGKIYFFTVFLYFFFFFLTTSTSIIYWFVTQNINVYSLFPLLTSFNSSPYFFSDKGHISGMHDDTVWAKFIMTKDASVWNINPALPWRQWIISLTWQWTI